jgi:hypothetical protein
MKFLRRSHAPTMSVAAPKTIATANLRRTDVNGMELVVDGGTTVI